MGFPWGFSGHNLVKRLCKSLLKKKLGDLILGDIDLDHLDLQFSKGTLQLSELALDVDFINRKLSGSMVMLKQGSIKSLTIKIPLNLSSEIVVEELELVLSPFASQSLATECSVSKSDDQNRVEPASTNDRHESVRELSPSTSRDIDEGVKKIANVVKWFLTSFHIRIKDVYVVFDPDNRPDDRKPQVNMSIVLRIKEIEFGTRLIDDSLLKLNNFIKFNEAVIDFLQMDHVNALLSSSPPTSISGPSTATLLTGPVGGFSGVLNLSIPWKNGSLNLQRIDADLSVDSLELRLQPCIIHWAVSAWDSLQSNNMTQQSCTHTSTDSTASPHRLFASPSPLYSVGDMNIKAEDIETSTENFLENNQDNQQDAFLTMTHVIQNYLPELIDQEDQTDLDLDCDASIDQFFECFEELRTSQMSLGNSGIWNWTCSVFNAITCASTLAAGSDQVPKEQLIEKTFRASISEISVVVFFSDEEHIISHNSNISSCMDRRSNDSYMSCYSSAHFEQPNIEINNLGLRIHHAKASCQEICLDLETYPEKFKLKVSIGSVKVDEYYDTGSYMPESGFVLNDASDNTFLSHYSTNEILAALPPFLTAPATKTHFAVKADAVSTCCCSKNQNGLSRVALLEFYDIFECCYEVSMSQTDGRSTTATSVSVVIPQLIAWVHFHSVYMLLEFLHLVTSTKSSNIHEMKTTVPSEGDDNTSTDNSGKSAKSSKAVSPSGNLVVHIALSPARIVVCFPSEFSGGLRHLSSLDTFIVFDHTVSLDKKESPFENFKTKSIEINPAAPSTSFCLGFRNVDVYFLESGKSNNSYPTSDKLPFSVSKIMSAGSKFPDKISDITMIWQSSCVAGPWMAERAWSLATLMESQISKNMSLEEIKIPSAGLSEKPQENSSSVCRELLQSSEFLLHARISQVSIHLSKKESELLVNLLSNVSDALSESVSMLGQSTEAHSPPNKHVVCQQSVYIECGILDVCTRLDEVLEVNHLMQTELEGYWSYLKLHVEKFECCSVLNVGELKNFSFLQIGHGEGELWGSMTSVRDGFIEVNKDFLLIACKNSTCGRGDGDGNNALSSCAAGSSVTHMHNPKLSQSYLSIGIYGVTVVVPGGRYDWINSMLLLFSSGPNESSHDMNDDLDISGMGNQTSNPLFFLELADVALSYEPMPKISMPSGGVQEFGPSGAEDSSKQYVGCLLASSSLRIFRSSDSILSRSHYCIRFRDLGFLIQKVHVFENVTCGYHEGYLRRSGYAKIAHSTILESDLLVDANMWKLEISNSQFVVDICPDTTYGLIYLSSQLQQLYAPDVKDALIHLQSRWNNLQNNNDQGSFSSSRMKEGSSLMKSVVRDCGPVGLLDEVLENAFKMDQEHLVVEDCTMENHVSSDAYEIVTGLKFDTGITKDNDADDSDIIYATSASNSEGDEFVDCHSSHIINTYCVSELPPSSSNDYLPTEGPYCKVDYDVPGDVKSGWYNDESLMIVEDHMSDRCSSYDDEQDYKLDLDSVGSDITEMVKLKGAVVLHKIDVRCRMHAGNDWSIYKKDSACSSAGQQRYSNSGLEVCVSGIDAVFLLYPDGAIQSSKISICAQDINVFDYRENAPWKMVLGCYTSKDYQRDSRSKALKIDLDIVRPEPHVPLEDYRLHVEFLPLILHLDQGQLNFLVSFFQKDTCTDSATVTTDIENLMREHTNSGSGTTPDEALLPFFQKFELRPLVIRIDYIPRHFDPVALSKGNYAELLNIIPWKGIELKLKPVSAVGIYGLNRICELVAGEWLEDISHNQVQKLLRGLPPIKSLYSVSSGTSKLVSLPVKSFKKDGKLLKGIQRGAVAFIRSISVEAIGLGVHLASGVHELLLNTECILTTLPSPQSSSDVKRKKENVRYNQPENTQQGVQQAYDSLTDGLGRTASALVGNPIKVYKRGGGVGSALASAMLGAPGAAIAPISSSARAVHYALVGLRNSLDPEHRRESVQKYLGPSQS